MQKKEEKWFFFFKPVSLSSRPPTRSPTPLDHRPKTLADHPPRAYPKNREQNLDSCTQMADQPPQPLLPMCNHKKPRPLSSINGPKNRGRKKEGEGDPKERERREKKKERTEERTNQREEGTNQKGEEPKYKKGQLETEKKKLKKNNTAVRLRQQHHRRCS